MRQFKAQLSRVTGFAEQLRLSSKYSVMLGIEESAEVNLEWVDKDPFNRDDPTVVFFELAPALSLPDAQPVGGPIRATGKPFLIDKGFQQKRSITVTGFPVPRQLSRRFSQDAGSQMRNPHPG